MISENTVKNRNCCFMFFNFDIPIRIYSIYSHKPYQSYEQSGYYSIYI